jgi:hypothetical protein
MMERFEARLIRKRNLGLFPRESFEGKIKKGPETGPCVEFSVF